MEVLVQRGTHAPSDLVVLLLDSAHAGTATVSVSHLGRAVTEVTATVGQGRSEVVLGSHPQGSYAVTVRLGDDVAMTAFDVLTDAGSRPRYGFVTDFRPGRDDAEEVADSLRGVHLTHVQFYDWMYRHAELVPPAEEFVDTLGRRLSLTVVRAFVQACHAAGAQAIAYAAVYGAGREYAAEHPEQVLLRPDGTPWMLGDFLWIADPSPGSPWTTHLVREMARAVEEVGFDGLHLDQYGDPKVALAADGRVVDLAPAFAAYIEAVRDRLPDATLIFNNVNDYPTRATAQTPQDVTYVEVWPPHDDHADLVDLVRRGRALAPSRPVVLAAYLAPFATATGPAEVAAATLALATVWAEGGQYLLFGERDGVLVHPYYPQYATLDAAAVRVLRAYADFAVANGDLLFAPEVLESTSHLVGGVNTDVEVQGVEVSLRPTAGRVWVRVATLGTRLVVQLVDHRDQADGRWNAPRAVPGLLEGVTLRVRVARTHGRAWVGHPRGGPHLTELPVRPAGDHVEVDLPALHTWALLLIER